MLRGERVPVRITSPGIANGNRVILKDGELLVVRGNASSASVAHSLERWLRANARTEIEAQVEQLVLPLGKRPNRIFVMDQRTKWGSCSSRGNLSFSGGLSSLPPLHSDTWWPMKWCTSLSPIIRSASG
jgi:predicted metal-dependent hydrolase